MRLDLLTLVSIVVEWVAQRELLASLVDARGGPCTSDYFIIFFSHLFFGQVVVQNFLQWFLPVSDMIHQFLRPAKRVFFPTGVLIHRRISVFLAKAGCHVFRVLFDSLRRLNLLS